jgi:hypothetical protein
MKQLKDYTAQHRLAADGFAATRLAAAEAGR